MIPNNAPEKNAILALTRVIWNKNSPPTHFAYLDIVNFSISSHVKFICLLIKIRPNSFLCVCNPFFLFCVFVLYILKIIVCLFHVFASIFSWWLSINCHGKTNFYILHDIPVFKTTCLSMLYIDQNYRNIPYFMLIFSVSLL